MIKDKILASLSKEERAQFDDALDHQKDQIIQNHLSKDEKREMAREIQRERLAREAMREAKIDYDCALAVGDANATMFFQKRLSVAVNQLLAVLGEIT